MFSGGLGHRGAPILRDPTFIEGADLVLMESTYGDRLHRPWEEAREIVASIGNAKGNILIPAFAVGRSQRLLWVDRLVFKRGEIRYLSNSQRTAGSNSHAQNLHE